MVSPVNGHPALDVAHWDDRVPPDIMIVAGNPVSITMQNGHLIVTDGTRSQPRNRRITRSQRQIRKIVLMSEHGYISLDACAWLRGCGIPLVSMAETPRYYDWQAIRGQVAQQPACVRYLIRRKIAGSATNLETLMRGTDARYVAGIVVPDDMQGIKNAEMRASRRYWSVWQETVSLPWHAKDIGRIPVHWVRSQLRKASSRSNNYDATDPVNAILNYAYRVGETACYEACVVTGLNPALGILHVPKTGRDSFVLDLLEAVRPLCDARVIRLVQTMSYFDPRWVHETGKGVCRLDAPLTHTISGWQGSLFDAALPVAIESARILGKDHGPTV